MLEQIIAILAVRLKVQRLQPPLDPAFEHRFFFLAKIYPRLRINQLAEPRIISCGNRFVVCAHDLNGAEQSTRPISFPLCCYQLRLLLGKRPSGLLLARFHAANRGQLIG